MTNKRYTREMIQVAVSACTSIRGMLTYFNLKETGGNYEAMSKRIRFFEVDISHFTGRGWSKGKTAETNDSIASLSKARLVPDEVVLTKDAPYLLSRDRLRKVAVKYISYECSVCAIKDEWNGMPLTLHLDHINGDNRDNRIENLRFICPNCHQQTPTWGVLNKNKTRKMVRSTGLEPAHREALPSQDSVSA